jgi:hypothetical protein
MTVQAMNAQRVWIISRVTPTEFANKFNVGCDDFKMTSRILDQAMHAKSLAHGMCSVDRALLKCIAVSAQLQETRGRKGTGRGLAWTVGAGDHPSGRTEPSV